tara:strand:- start:1367 stop:1597 length:231 start_codon:yes stop_codon:yes gene_type:complete
MFENIEDVKLFIQWCKSNKVKIFKSDNIQFELSEISFVEGLGVEENLQTHLDESEHDAKQQEQQENDELLFWSSNT